MEVKLRAGSTPALGTGSSSISTPNTFMEKVFLLCMECRNKQDFGAGTSDLGELPEKAHQGEVIKYGSLHSWIVHHHEKYHSNHNRFTVFNEQGETIGVAGFGSQTGYTFIERPAGNSKERK